MTCVSHCLLVIINLLCRSIICIQNWVPHLSSASCYRSSFSSSLCLPFLLLVAPSLHLLRAWNPWYLLLILIFPSYPTPSISKLMWALSLCYTQNLTNSPLLLPVFRHKPSGNPYFTIEQPFNFPTFQCVIKWAGRIILLKGMLDHVSPFLQAFHGLPILPTMKTKSLQWFISSVHIMALDYLPELTSYYIPCTPGFSHPGHFAVLWTEQAHSYLRVIALSVSTA